MTVHELAAVDGCFLGADGLRARIVSKTDRFKTLHACVFTPKLVNGNASKKNRLKVEETKRDSWNEQIDLINLWKAGSLADKARIIQGVNFT